MGHERYGISISFLVQKCGIFSCPGRRQRGIKGLIALSFHSIYTIQDAPQGGDTFKIGEIFSDGTITNFLLILTVEKV